MQTKKDCKSCNLFLSYLWCSSLRYTPFKMRLTTV
nr:MAG TPA: hypothetical protein [Bacteriophage sp.]